MVEKKKIRIAIDVVWLVARMILGIFPLEVLIVDYAAIFNATLEFQALKKKSDGRIEKKIARLKRELAEAESKNVVFAAGLQELKNKYQTLSDKDWEEISLVEKSSDNESVQRWKTEDKLGIVWRIFSNKGYEKIGTLKDLKAAAEKLGCSTIKKEDLPAGFVGEGKKGKAGGTPLKSKQLFEMLDQQLTAVQKEQAAAGHQG